MEQYLFSPGKGKGRYAVAMIQGKQGAEKETKEPGSIENPSTLPPAESSTTPPDNATTTTATTADPPSGSQEQLNVILEDLGEKDLLFTEDGVGTVDGTWWVTVKRWKWQMTDV
jgi:hypothetical protein